MKCKFNAQHLKILLQIVGCECTSNLILHELVSLVKYIRYPMNSLIVKSV